MIERGTSKLFYLTEPSRGVFVANFQVDGGALERIEISRDQLANFLADGTAIAFRDSKTKTENV